MTTSMRAPSWNDDVRACALTNLFSYSDLRHYFLICGYEIFPSLLGTISYPQTMSVYDLCITFSFSFVSTLWRHFFVPFSLLSTLYPIMSPYVSTLDLILYPPVSMLDSISSWFCLTLTTFPTIFFSLFLQRPLRPLSTLVSPRERALCDVTPTTT